MSLHQVQMFESFTLPMDRMMVKHGGSLIQMVMFVNHVFIMRHLLNELHLDQVIESFTQPMDRMMVKHGGSRLIQMVM